MIHSRQNKKHIAGPLVWMAWLLVQPAAVSAAQPTGQAARTTLATATAATAPSPPPAISAPALTLEDCQRLARENYPLVRKLDLIGKSSEYSLANASTLHLPQLSIRGQATYQSETVDFAGVSGGALPPGAELPSLSKDQYKIQAELSQSLYDGGAVARRKEQLQASAAIEKQSVEVTLYALRDRVNQLYFSILLMEEQLKQNQTRKADLENMAKKIAAALKYGTAFRSNLNELRAEVVKAEMTSIQLRRGRTAYLSMLGLLIDKELPDDTRLEMPAEVTPPPGITRPELTLYSLKNDLLDVKEKKLQSDLLPKLDVFFQGAYGRPTLNFIQDDFGSWYLTGIRLTWNFGSLYTLKNDRRNLNTQRETIALEKETFLLNTRLSLRKESQEIQKYRELLAADKEAIKLRASVKESAEAQLKNGVITTNEYISQLNAENLARQTFILHRIGLLQAQYNYRHRKGNHISN